MYIQAVVSKIAIHFNIFQDLAWGGEMLKRTRAKRYQDTVLWARLEIVSLLRGTNPKQHVIIAVIGVEPAVKYSFV